MTRSRRQHAGPGTGAGVGSETGVVVGVGIDPTAISEPIAALDPALARSVHEELLETLSIHGRLVFTSRLDRDVFIDQLGTLPTGLAKLWESLLSSGRIRLEVLDPEVEPGISQTLDPQQVADLLGSRVDLVLLERDHAELLGVPPIAFSVLAPGGRPELGRLATANRTIALSRARELVDAPIRAGENREVIWQQRLAPFVAATKMIVIYDRYAGIQAARRYVYDLRSQDGLTWLLDKIGNFSGKRVRLITATTQDSGSRRLDAEVVAAGLQRLRWAMGEREVQLDVVLVPDGSRRFGHDRHVRFGDRVALAFGTGIGVFARPIVDETVTVARLPIADAKDREAGSERHQLRPPKAGWIRNQPAVDGSPTVDASAAVDG